MSTSGELFGSYFETELLETVEAHPDMDRWSVAGKAKKHPEDVDWWRANGPAMVDNYIKWRQRSGWKPWRTPDGELAIELDISIDIPLPGCNKGEDCTQCQIPLKMFVDQVMVSQPARELVIVDLKTGARTPESDLQLAVYRLGILRKYGVDVRLGAYWMARKGELSEVFDLQRFRPELLELWFARFRQATDEGIFIPHPTFLCRACAMRDYCTAYGGNKQHMDPDNAGESNE